MTSLSNGGPVGVARIGLLWRGERRSDAPPTRGDALLGPLIDALSRLDVVAQPVVYSDDAVEDVREELLQLDGVLVWVNPIQDGRDRSQLDALLRDLAGAGVWVSAHPDTILRMGSKDVLYTTKSLGWGTDTELYETPAEMSDRFPSRLGTDRVRVLKQHRGNGGQGVWKVELVDAPPGSNAGPESQVRVQHADKRDARIDEMPLIRFMDMCAPYFASSGHLVDQAFQARLSEGMVRCYLVRNAVVGFCHQWPKGLLPLASRDGGATGAAHLMEPASTPAYQALKTKMEAEWVPQMMEVLDIEVRSMPVIWDADFLYGPKTATGEDTYVLCEINVSAVWPYPEVANPKLADAAAAATIEAKAWRAAASTRRPRR